MKGHHLENMSNKPVCVSDFEHQAKKNLPKAVFDYYFSGADQQESLADNVAAFKRYVTIVWQSACSVQRECKNHKTVLLKIKKQNKD